MKAMIVTLSLAAALAMTSCMTDTVKGLKPIVDSQMEQMMQTGSAVDGAISSHSPDFQEVQISGDTVVYTHIFDGIVDIKTYVYNNDTCVEVERVYAFPDQMSALRHYRRAVEQAELYDGIQLMKNEVLYKLKENQYKLETNGLTKEALKAKFDKQIADVKADYEKVKTECKDCK